jgi:hypothetical protein
MTSFFCLSDELLLQVAGHLLAPTEEVSGVYHLNREDTLFRTKVSDTDTDLRHLCLTARRLRPIACEALYRYTKLTGAAQRSPLNRAAPVTLLLRTLINRPDVACLIQDISLVVHSQMRGHSLHGHCGYKRADDPQDTDVPARNARIPYDTNEKDPDKDYELAQEQPNDTDSDEDEESEDNTIVRSHHFIGLAGEELVSAFEQSVERQEMRLWVSAKLQGLPAGSRS